MEQTQVSNLEAVKAQIMRALLHPEAEEGLYFHNFTTLHEEDERDAVEGDQVEILDALKVLMEEGRVRSDESGSEVVFHAIR